jgi:ubiquinone/menaquinone biosynthesis C-methylase UbiE
MESEKRFADYFSSTAPKYLRFRPTYPPELFEYLVSNCQGHECALDCGTGSGQAALGLTQFFRRVVATDASRQQIENAVAHEKIFYVAARAEALPLQPRSVDLFMVAQALHWFDFERFYAEVRRVLKPGGLFAASCYHWTRITPEVDAVRDAYQKTIVGAYWPPGRHFVDEMYRTIPFPLKEIPAPVFTMEYQWNMHDLIGYLETWSATQQYKEKNGTNPIDQIRENLQHAWGDPEEQKRVVWPLYLRVGTV